MRIGFIGAGNMGAALIKGYAKVNTRAGESIFVYDTSQACLDALKNLRGVEICNSVGDLVNKSQILIIAVKPNVISQVIGDIVATDAWNDKVIVSIAAGISLEYISNKCKKLSSYLGKDEDFICKLVRVMPNTPALIGEGMSALTKNQAVSQEEFEKVMDIFRGVGKAEELDEHLFDCVTAVSGSGPAYVYLFIEAMADGAVALGMNRKQAYAFAAQTLAGSANMVLTTNSHPGDLKDKVCSPAGTTIEAVGVLEEKGFRSAVIAAVKAAGLKSEQMGMAER